MNNILLHHNGFTFKRVNRTAAKHLYKTGLSFYVCPVKLDPFNMWWASGYKVEPNRISCDYKDFDTFLNNYEYYNCNNAEVGLYPAFYVPINEGRYDYSFMKEV